MTKKMLSRFKVISKLRSLGNVYSTASSESPKPKYSKLFFDEKVQNILQKLTNVNVTTVFEGKKFGKQLEHIKYELLTAEELTLKLQEIEKTKSLLLQIPPLITPKEDTCSILEETPSLDGHDFHYSKFVFTDISFDVSNEERAIVIREPNGVLRTALRNERQRINQIYYPTPGRKLEMPKMFQDNYFKSLLKREEYIFILDSACAQFEPEDPIYHNVIEQTYEQINDKKHFQRLFSTRHFGSLIFYLVTHKKIDNLLIDLIKSERIDDAHDLVKLFHIIHPNCKSSQLINKTSDVSTDENNILKNYIDCDAVEKQELELALQTYLIKEQQKTDLSSERKEAHGSQ